MRWWPLLALPVFVLVSSWLGLNAYASFAIPEHDEGRFFRDVWANSVLADAVFVGGSIAAAIATYALARRRTWASAFATGIALQWLVYLTSFRLLSLEARPEGTTWDSFGLVGIWGFAGLVFAAAAPVIAARPRIGLHEALAAAGVAIFLVASGSFVLMEHPTDDPLTGAFGSVAQTFWSAATLALVAGSLAIMRPALRLAKQRPIVAAVASAAGHVLVLALALALRTDTSSNGPGVSIGGLLAGALTGWAGLIAAAVAPVAGARFLPREDGPAAEETSKA